MATSKSNADLVRDLIKGTGASQNTASKAVAAMVEQGLIASDAPSPQFAYGDMGEVQLVRPDENLRLACLGFAVDAFAADHEKATGVLDTAKAFYAWLTEETASGDAG